VILFSYAPLVTIQKFACHPYKTSQIFFPRTKFSRTSSSLLTGFRLWRQYWRKALGVTFLKGRFSLKN
jgi:hypothetical protein